MGTQTQHNKPNSALLFAIAMFYPTLSFYYAGASFRFAISLGVVFDLISALTIFASDSFFSWKYAFVAMVLIAVVFLLLQIMASFTIANRFRDKPIEARSYKKFIAISILVLILFGQAIDGFISPVWKTFKIPTASMEPTFTKGDRVRVNLQAYTAKGPNVGDLVVFRYPADPSISYLQRVVAVSGDKVRIVDNLIYLNGVQQTQEAVADAQSILKDVRDYPEMKLLFNEKLGETSHFMMQNSKETRPPHLGDWPNDGTDFLVPAGQFAVLGDNRHNSNDSRIFGPVSNEYLIGKAEGIVFNVNSDDSLTWNGRRVLLDVD